MTKTNIKTGSTETHTKATAQQNKNDLAKLQRQIRELMQKLENSEWRRKELESYLKMLIETSNEETLERAGLFKRPTTDCTKQALETCGLDT